MSQLEVLLKSIPLYANLEETERLQAGPDGLIQVAAQVISVTEQLASELLAEIAVELSQRDVQGCVKDPQRAEELRISGNEAFAKGEYLIAAHRFSQSLRFLNPYQPGCAAACAKVLCNRALCLLKLKQYRPAEEDCTAAIEYDPQNAKAVYRRATAYNEQGNFFPARDDAERAVQLLNEQKERTVEAETLLALLNNKCSGGVGGSGVGETTNTATRGAGGGDGPIWTSHTVPPELWDTAEQGTTSPIENNLSVESSCWADCGLETVAALANKKAAQAGSRGFTVVEASGVGRQLVTTQGVAAGTDMLKDSPIVHALAKAQRLERCAHCCTALPLEGAVFWPCTSCALSVFCSRECRDQENTQHAAGGPECGVPWTALLPPEAVLAVRLARRMREASLLSSPEDACLVAGSLETHFADMMPEDALHDATVACAAHAAWKLALQNSQNYGKSRFSQVWEAVSVADVLHALCIVSCNGLAITPRAFGNSEEAIGIAIYPIASFMTHSCIPNVSLRFEGNTAIARSTAPLSPGTPLLHSYGPQAGEMTTFQRQVMLKAQYHFTCQCKACSGVSPGEAEKEAAMVGLKCMTAGCDGALPVPCEAEAGVASKYDLQGSVEDGCSVCGAKLSEKEWNSSVGPRLEKALEAYSIGRKAVQGESAGGGGGGARSDGEKGVQLLEESLNTRKELLHRHNQVLGATYDALSWAEESSKSAKVEHSRASLEVAERLFPAGSTNVAYEKLTLGTMLQHEGSEKSLKEGKELVTAAMATLELHYGAVPSAADVSFLQ